jgi:membrane protein required for colicin V production
MMAGMNGLDYAIVAIVGLGALHGLSRGALRMATSLLSLAAGIYAASTWYGQAAAIAQSRLGTSPAMSEVIGYAAVFAIVFLAVEYAGGRVVRLAQIIHLNWIDRIGGGIFGAALALVFAGFNILLLTAILPAKPPLLRDSELAPRVIAYNQVLVGYVPPQVKTLYDEKRGELMRYWADKHPEPATSPETR